MVQPNSALFGADHGVFDPDAELSFEIDARLVAEGHPGFERQIVTLDEIGFLMDFQAEPVADPVQECLAVPSVSDELAGSAIQFLERFLFI